MNIGSAQVGHARRLNSIFSPETGRTVIVPFDDVLISDPLSVGNGDWAGALNQVLDATPDAVVGFERTLGMPGVHQSSPQTAFICNLTMSYEGHEHTRKMPFGSIRGALAADASAIAVHVNCQSKYREDQFATLLKLGDMARSMGLPTFGFLYPRGENSDGTDNNFTELRDEDPMTYARLVCEGVRRGVDLGVDAIKTQWTGTIKSFELVVAAAQGRKVVIAGGARMDTRAALQMAHDAREAGASGTSFGRNVFNNPYPGAMTAALKWVVHHGLSIGDAMELYADVRRSHRAAVGAVAAK